MKPNEKDFFVAALNRGGYVLDFSTVGFDNFTQQHIGDRLCEKYGVSKGKSLQKYCSEANEKNVFTLLSALIEYYELVYQFKCPENFNPDFLAKAKVLLEKEKANLESSFIATFDSTDMKPGEVKTFSKKLKYIKQLGAGASGEIYLFEDNNNDRKIAIKKSMPDGGTSPESYQRFKTEVALLSQTCHKNIVRLYDYYLYPQKNLGYILMEYIDGEPIDTSRPERYNKTWEDLFCEALNGFTHLEHLKIVHRDIRTANILVDTTGTVKIIDFGFGKRENSSAVETSMMPINRVTSEKPEEEKDNHYDTRTDIFYLGHLFKTCIPDSDYKKFRYKDILEKMMKLNPVERFQSFDDIQKAISENKHILGEMFSETELALFRSVSLFIRKTVTLWYEKPTMLEPSQIINRLEELIRCISLEQFIPDNHKFISCFTNSGCKCKSGESNLETEKVAGFIQVLKDASDKKMETLLMNLKSSIDSVSIESFSGLPF